MTSPASSPERPSPPRRLAVLDTLRFVAAFLVVLYHFTVFGDAVPGHFPWPRYGAITRVTGFGYLGVQLFFFISGFVILMTAWGKSTAQFASSRVSRLFPAYWVSVLFNGAIAMMLPRPAVEAAALPTNIFGNLAMVHDAAGVPAVESVYWTLWAELRFYLWIGVFMVIGITRARVLAFTLIWPLLGPMASVAHLDFFAAIFVDRWAPFFAAGMLIYLVYREGWSWTVALLMGYNLTLCVQPVVNTAMGVETTTGHPTSPRIALAIVVLMFLAVLAATVTPLARFHSRLLTWLGLLTYPIYLIHRAVGSALNHWFADAGPWLYLLVACAISIAVAIAIYQLVERPLGPRLRSRLRRELERVARADRDDPITVPPLRDDPPQRPDLAAAGEAEPPPATLP